MRSAPITFDAPFALGKDLTPADQAEVLQAYVSRNSGVLLKLTDAQWLAGTFFKVRKDGRLDRRFKRCECAVRDAVVAEAEAQRHA